MLAQEFVRQRLPNANTAFAYSDWADDREGRKSASGGVIFIGQHAVKAWSSTQQVTALLSGEAELNALLRGATHFNGYFGYVQGHEV